MVASSSRSISGWIWRKRSRRATSQVAAKEGTTLTVRRRRRRRLRILRSPSAMLLKPWLRSPRPCPAGLCQLPFAIDPAQELGVQIGFQELHLLADGRRRHMQLRRRPLEALMPGGRLEGAQGIEGGKAFRHGRST
jgi:hypothetical protein